MEESELLIEGMTLMALGMGFVFVFLTVLVIATTGMSWVVRRFTPEPVEVANLPSHSPARQDDGELMAVIAAALHRYRRRR
jgi:oxaloacetate decarboxylase gamma subunit